MSNSDNMMQSKSFFASLFDFSFSSFVTLRFIKVLYGIFMVIAGIIGLAIFFAFATQGGFSIVIALILGPIAFFIYLLIYRVLLEFIVVIFRIAENTSIMASNSQPPNSA